MFCKAFFFALGLALLAASTPVERDGGITIPLPKRASLTKPDGTFDHEAARAHTAKTIKYVLFYDACLNTDLDSLCGN